MKSLLSASAMNVKAMVGCRLGDEASWLFPGNCWLWKGSGNEVSGRSWYREPCFMLFNYTVTTQQTNTRNSFSFLFVQEQNTVFFVAAENPLLLVLGETLNPKTVKAHHILRTATKQPRILLFLYEEVEGCRDLKRNEA